MQGFIFWIHCDCFCSMIKAPFISSQSTSDPRKAKVKATTTATVRTTCIHDYRRAPPYSRAVRHLPLPLPTYHLLHTRQLSARSIRHTQRYNRRRTPPTSSLFELIATSCVRVHEKRGSHKDDDVSELAPRRACDRIFSLGDRSAHTTQGQSERW